MRVLGVDLAWADGIVANETGVVAVERDGKQRLLISATASGEELTHEAHPGYEQRRDYEPRRHSIPVIAVENYNRAEKAE